MLPRIWMPPCVPFVMKLYEFNREFNRKKRYYAIVAD